MKHLIAALLIAPAISFAQFHTDEAAREVERCSPGLTIEQTAALVSFAYSMGPGRYCTSTVAALVKKGRIADACAILSKYIYDDWSNKSQNMVRRRNVERALCESAS